jgi:hypothetical protein
VYVLFRIAFPFLNNYINYITGLDNIVTILIFDRFVEIIQEDGSTEGINNENHAAYSN